ncbi:MAG: shikimate dehydrogenase [Pseudomonadota bacterium]
MKQLRVVGNPVAHSLSPQIHAGFAAQLGHAVTYDKQHVELGEFASAADKFRSAGGAGMNITVPFKTDAFDYAERLDPAAEFAGAVNTLDFAAGEVVGYNTDGVGLVADLVGRHGVPLANKRILLIGAGGAGRGVVAPLLDAQPAELIVANRTLSRAQELVALGSARAGSTALKATTLPLAQPDSGPLWADVVINGTSLGLGDAALDEQIGTKLKLEESFCYDMSYGVNARFQAWALARGAAGAVDGLGMLVEQAAAAYAIWLGSMPETEPVYATLRDLVDA